METPHQTITSVIRTSSSFHNRHRPDMQTKRYGKILIKALQILVYPLGDNWHEIN